MALKKSQPKNAEKGTEQSAPKVMPRVPERVPALRIRQAWITEKAGMLSTGRKYIFIVEKDANKPEIKKAIETMYKVKVEGVNVINTKGKMKRLGRSVGRSANYKKAIVSLKEGNTIDIMPH